MILNQAVPRNESVTPHDQYGRARTQIQQLEFAFSYGCEQLTVLGTQPPPPPPPGGAGGGGGVPPPTLKARMDEGQ